MKNKKFHLCDYIYMTAGILLFLTMLSIWMLSGMFAKYASGNDTSDGARVAAFGTVEIKEHEAVNKKELPLLSTIEDIYYGNDEYNDMVYTLDQNKEVDYNKYSILMPGVDIPKDTFVRITPGEVDCELYIRAVADELPRETDAEVVKYELDPELWEKLPPEKQDENGVVYKYRLAINANSGEQQIRILKDNKIYISQHYDADKYYSANGGAENGSFLIMFKAWLVQKD